MSNIFKNTVLRKYVETFNKNSMVKFYPPKLAIIKDRSVLVINVEKKLINYNESEVIDYNYDLPHDIIDSFLQEHLLWLIVGNIQLIVIDLISGSKIQLINNDLSNYKISKFKTDGTNLYIMSESEESLLINCTHNDILNRIIEGVEQYSIYIEKIRTRHSLLHQQTYYDYIQSEENVTGLQLHIERGALVVACANTGLRAVALSLDTHQWNSVLPWGDMVVLADESNISITHLNNSNIKLDIKANGFCQPLTTHHHFFYYLTSNDKEVCYF